MNRTETFQKAKEILNNPKASADELAKVIAEDQVLTKSLKKLIKSFGFPPKACTVTNAILLLGLDTMRTIITEHRRQPPQLY